MRENLVATLSPDELHTKAGASIGIAYSYLTSELKQLCVNLSHFPVSFDKESATFIYDFKETMLNTLVRRSLLQYIRQLKVYFFHRLLKKVFIRMSNGEAEVIKKHFSAKFQLYFAKLICNIIPDNDPKIDLLILSRFIKEEANIIYMLLMFKEQKDVNVTFVYIGKTANSSVFVVLKTLWEAE